MKIKLYKRTTYCHILSIVWLLNPYLTLNVVGGIASNAAFVGAKSVIGPGCDRRSTSPAARTSDTRVVNSGWKTTRSRTEQSGVQAPAHMDTC